MNLEKKEDAFVSVVMATTESLGALKADLFEVQGALERHFVDYEIVIVRGGPLQEEREQDEILKSLPCVRILQLSSRVSEEVLWGAGLENAIGDFVVIFDAAHDPAGILHEVVAQCRSGRDVIIGTAAGRRSLLYRLFRFLAGGLLKLVEYRLPRDATTLRCLSRRAVNSITRTGRYHQRLGLRIQKTGYPDGAFPYSLKRPGPRLGVADGIRSLVPLVVFNSSRPLRWMSFLGLLGSSLAFGFGLYSVILHWISARVVEGWTTTILLISSISFIQFLMLAFFGEYLARLLDERGEKDDFAVVYEKHSTVMVDKDRVNVLREAARE